MRYLPLVGGCVGQPVVSAFKESSLTPPRRFHKNINLVLRPEILVPQMDAAVAELYSKLGRPLPAGFPKPFDPGVYQHRRSGGWAPLGRRLLTALARGFRGWDR